MRKRSSLFVAVMTFFLVVALSAPGVDAKKKNYFEVSKYKIDGTKVGLTKSASKTFTADDISQSVSDTRPKMKLYFKELRNKKTKTTIAMQLDFTPTDTSDQRTITMNAKVIVKVAKNGKKIKSAKIKGGKFTYEGTLSNGLPANGATLVVDKSALTKGKKVLILNSETLLSGLTAEDKIGDIGTQVGSYDYKLTLTGAIFKLKDKKLKKIKGTLNVTE